MKINPTGLPTQNQAILPAEKAAVETNSPVIKDKVSLGANKSASFIKPTCDPVPDFHASKAIIPLAIAVGAAVTAGIGLGAGALLGAGVLGKIAGTVLMAALGADAGMFSGMEAARLFYPGKSTYTPEVFEAQAAGSVIGFGVGAAAGVAMGIAGVPLAAAAGLGAVTGAINGWFIGSGLSGKFNPKPA